MVSCLYWVDTINQLIFSQLLKMDVAIVRISSCVSIGSLSSVNGRTIFETPTADHDIQIANTIITFC